MDHRLQQLKRRAQDDPSAIARYWRALLQSSTIPLWYIQALGIMGDPIAKEVAPYDASRPPFNHFNRWFQIIDIIGRSPNRRDLYSFTVYYLDHFNQAWCDAYPEYGLRYDDENSECLDYLASLGPTKLPEMAKLAAQFSGIIHSFRDRMDLLQLGGAVIDCADIIEIDLLDIIYNLLRSIDETTGNPLMNNQDLYSFMVAHAQSGHAESNLVYSPERDRIAGQLLLPFNENPEGGEGGSCEMVIPKANATWKHVLSIVLQNHNNTVGVFYEENHGNASKILAASREFNFDVTRQYIAQAIANSH